MKRFETPPSNLSTASAFVLVILVGLLATTCQAGNATSVGTDARTLSQLLAGIVIRTGDLNYITEQDSEVFAFYRNTAVREMSEARFLELLRLPKETRIIKQSWSTFFKIQTRQDSGSRWRELQEYLEANLTNLTVFKVPRDEPYDSQYDLYVVGLFNGDTVVGIQMFGVAT